MPHSPQNDIMYPDYDKCLTNVACTILKQFGLPHHHPSLPVLDKVFAEKEYKNVILLIYDGMGMNILTQNLAENSFLRRHLVDTISSIFPTTTAAATTSLRSGLNPCENGWVGWDVYIKAVDEIITVFRNQKKGSDTPFSAENTAEKYLGYRSLVTQINQDTLHDAVELFPFGDDPYHGLDDFNQRIIDLCARDGRQFIHAYHTNPDGMLHDYGTTHDVIRPMMQEIDRSTEALIANLRDTLVICLADHGHLDVEEIVLTRDYPDMVSLFARDNTAIDGRACAFWIDEANKPLFEKKFAEYFGHDFMLLTKQQVIDKKLFGNNIGHGIATHGNFDDSLGDYIAVGIGNKYFQFEDGKHRMWSHHAGITRNEMSVPLIIFKT